MARAKLLRKAAFEYEPWLGVDLDSSLALPLDDYTDPTLIGEPIPAMVAKIKKVLAEGMRVKVFTARMADQENSVAIREAIANWTLEHIGTALEATNEKDPGTIEIWDDKARRVEKDTGKAAATQPVTPPNTPPPGPQPPKGRVTKKYDKAQQMPLWLNTVAEPEEAPRKSPHKHLDIPSPDDMPDFEEFIASFKGGIKGMLDYMGDAYSHYVEIANMTTDGFDELGRFDQARKVLEHATEDCDSKYYEAKSRFESFSFPLDLYREVTLAGGIESLKTDGIGIYWTWDENAAEAHCGHYSKGEKQYTLRCEVKASDVDWYDTLFLNMDPSTGEEKEIRLKEGVRVKVTGWKESSDREWQYPWDLPMNITASKTAREDFNEDGYWAGEGNAASGILPIAKDTKRICLAWRSSDVHEGDCYGTLGGAIKDKRSPAESAKAEMKEEVGYGGSVELHPAFEFHDGDFTYFNFIGICSNEFKFAPASEHSWETDHIDWLTYEEIMQGMKDSPGDYHSGVIALFKNSRKLIEGLVGEKGKKEAAGMEHQTPNPRYAGTMYHVSLRKNRAGIQRKGLLPLVKEFPDVERKPGIYLLETYEQAEDWAYWFGGFGDHIKPLVDIWSVDIPVNTSVHPDQTDMDDKYDSWVVYDPIPAGSLRLLKTIGPDYSDDKRPPFASKIPRTAAAAPTFTYTAECLDHHHEETFCRVNAQSATGDYVGFISYGIYEDQIHIKMIEVMPEYRRQGVATGMMAMLREENPGMPINWGMLTDEGGALKAKVHQPGDEPPNRLLKELEESREQFASEAQERYDSWPIQFDEWENDDSGLASQISDAFEWLVGSVTRGNGLQAQIGDDWVVNCQGVGGFTATVCLPSEIVQQRVGDKWRKKPGVTIQAGDIVITSPEAKTAAGNGLQSWLKELGLNEPIGKTATTGTLDHPDVMYDGENDEVTRIISARKADATERSVYSGASKRSSRRQGHRLFGCSSPNQSQSECATRPVPRIPADFAPARVVAQTLNAVTASELNSFRLDPEAEAIVDKHEALGLMITVTGGNKHMPDTLTLNAISMPKALRNQGLGAAFMEELVDYADREGKTIFLSPSKDFGATSVARLRRFYGRFGFKRNLGRNKDFRSRDSMIRLPKRPVGKKASPDFGYTHYKDREADLSKLEWITSATPLSITISAWDVGQEPPPSTPAGKLTALGESSAFAAKNKKGPNVGADGRVLDTFILRSVNIDGDWRGTGLGQLLYDRLIEEAVKLKARFIRSDASGRMSADAQKAWKRLSQRYPVETHSGNYPYLIDLTKLKPPNSPVGKKAVASTLPKLSEILTDQLFGSFSQYVDWGAYEPLVIEKAKSRGKDYESLSEGEQDELCDEVILPELQSRYQRIKAVYDGPFPLTVYRALDLANGLNDLDTAYETYGAGKGVGVYWSFTLANALSYGGKHRADFVLKGLVAKDSVNWKVTAEHNVATELETEIRLLPGATIQIESIKTPKGWQKPPKRLRTVTAAGIPYPVTAPKPPKKAADVGYSHYNNREEELAQVEFRVVDDNDNRFGIDAFFGEDEIAGGDEQIGGMGCVRRTLNGHWGFIPDPVSILRDWRGTGLGQLLYDRAIVEAKNRGADFFASGERSPDAKRAWERLKQRYSVETVNDRDVIFFNTSKKETLKKADLPKNPPGKPETEYPEWSNGWALFPDQRPDQNEDVDLEKMVPLGIGYN